MASDGEIRHGPADAYGRCPWCHVKYEAARPRPDFGNNPSDLSLAYALAYDPDFTGLDPIALRARYGYREASAW